MVDHPKIRPSRQGPKSWLPRLAGFLILSQCLAIFVPTILSQNVPSDLQQKKERPGLKYKATGPWSGTLGETRKSSSDATHLLLKRTLDPFETTSGQTTGTESRNLSHEAGNETTTKPANVVDYASLKGAQNLTGEDSNSNPSGSTDVKLKVGLSDVESDQSKKNKATSSHESDSEASPETGYQSLNSSGKAQDEAKAMKSKPTESTTDSKTSEAGSQLKSSSPLPAGNSRAQNKSTASDVDVVTVNSDPKLKNTKNDPLSGSTTVRTSLVELPNSDNQSTTGDNQPLKKLPSHRDQDPNSEKQNTSLAGDVLGRNPPSAPTGQDGSITNHAPQLNQSPKPNNNNDSVAGYSAGSTSTDTALSSPGTNSMPDSSKNSGGGNHAPADNGGNTSVQQPVQLSHNTVPLPNSIFGDDARKKLSSNATKWLPLFDSNHSGASAGLVSPTPTGQNHDGQDDNNQVATHKSGMYNLDPNSTIASAIFHLPTNHGDSEKNGSDQTGLSINSSVASTIFHLPSHNSDSGRSADSQVTPKPDTYGLSPNNSVGSTTFHLPTPNLNSGKDGDSQAFKPDNYTLNPNNSVASTTFHIQPITLDSGTRLLPNKSIPGLPLSGATWSSNNITSLFPPAKSGDSGRVSRLPFPGNSTSWQSGNFSVAPQPVSSNYLNGSSAAISAPFRINSTDKNQGHSDDVSSQIISSNPFSLNSSLSKHPSTGNSLLPSTNSSSIISFLPPSIFNHSTGSIPFNVNGTALAGLPFKVPTNNSDTSTTSPPFSLSTNFSNGHLMSNPFQIHANNTGISLTGSGELLDGNNVNKTTIIPLPGFTNVSIAGAVNGTTSSNNVTVVPVVANPTNNHPSYQQPAPAPAFVPSGSLFTSPATAQRANITVPTPSQPTVSSAPAKHEAPASFPSTLPRYIVPTGAPASSPSNTTLISILFTEALNWHWLVTNSNASSQVLVFMPALISSSLEIPSNQVVTQSLQAYQSASFDSKSEDGMLALWLGYIPSQFVDALQAMIRAPQSRFYTGSDLLLNALAKTVDSSFPITSFSHKAPASQAAVVGVEDSPGDTTPVDRGQKIAVIASVTTCGAAILAMGLIFAARRSKRKMTGKQSGHSRLEEGGPMNIGAPMMTEAPRVSSGFFYSRTLPLNPVGDPDAGYAAPLNRESAQYHAVTAADDESTQVRYEYGQARTTSMSGASGHRLSWWWRLSNSGTPGGAPTRGAPTPAGALEELEGGSESLERSRSAESASGDANHGYRPGQGHRRLRITRGADGLVSGIGRPVMKENSLFF